MSTTRTAWIEAANARADLYKPNAAFARQFAADILGARLWSKQLDILDAVHGDKRNIAVQAATGVGKSMVGAVCALAWLMGAKHRFVISTAPTRRQVEDLLWKEVRLLYSAALRRGYPIGGNFLPQAPRLTIADGWGALGFSSTNEVNFQGYHSRGGTLVIVDEATGVADSTFDALEGTMTGRHDRMLALANPTRPVGRFFDLCKHQRFSSTTARFTISAYDTPNVKRGRVVIPGMVERETIEAKEQAWGRSSPMFQARVLGEFPEQADNVLVPLAWIEAAVARFENLKANGEGFAGNAAVDRDTEAGVDVARKGADTTVLAPITWGKALIVIDVLRKIRKHDLMEVVGFIAANIRELKLSRVKVDDGGMGGGVVDRLAEQALPVVKIVAAARANDPTRFANLRAEMLWTFRSMLDPSAEIPMAIAPDDDLMQQATTILYSFDSQGRILVESKDDWSKRMTKTGGDAKPSPDELDAVSYAVADRIEIVTSLATYLAAYG